MFKNMGISFRTSMSFILMVAVIIAIVMLAVVVQFRQITTSAELSQLQDLQKSLQSKVDDTAEHAMYTIDGIIAAPGVIEAFAANDRATLEMLTVPSFEVLKRKYHLQQFQFHTPPATSFLRVHKLDKYGDDLSSFRKTVVEVNHTKQRQYGLEKGVAGIGLRGVVPVYYQNRHIGSAELGMSFGQDFFNSFAARYSAPSALYISDQAGGGSGFKTFASTIPGGATTVTKQSFDLALQNSKITHNNVVLDGRPFAAIVAPVNDFSGQPLGVVEIMIDRSDFAALYSQTLIRIIIIGIVSLLIGLMLSLLLSKSVTKPIEDLTDSAEEVSRGNFDVTITGTDRKDEVGSLARAVERMAESIKLAMERLRS